MRTYDSKNYLINATKTKTYSQIAKEHNVDLSTIYRKCRKFGLTDPSEKWTKKELQLLKKEYTYNPEVHKLFPNRTKSSVYHKASRLRLPNLIRKSKHRVNQFFFQKWSPEMAYIFGWFCSDGSVSSNNNRCLIALNPKDYEILEKIKFNLNSSHPIHKYQNKNQTSVSLVIYNKLLHDDLVKLGCMPNKTKIFRFPKVPKKFISHFIRGYFDGDGSIHFNKPNTIKLKFCGTKHFIQNLQIILQQILKIKPHKYWKHRHIWNCQYYGKDARKICYWMYKDCKSLYLKRKKERFNNHIKQRTIK